MRVCIWSSMHVSSKLTRKRATNTGGYQSCSHAPGIRPKVPTVAEPSMHRDPQKETQPEMM
jgi:hypothetical protein